MDYAKSPASSFKKQKRRHANSCSVYVIVFLSSFASFLFYCYLCQERYPGGMIAAGSWLSSIFTSKVIAYFYDTNNSIKSIRGTICFSVALIPIFAFVLILWFGILFAKLDASILVNILSYPGITSNEDSDGILNLLTHISYFIVYNAITIWAFRERITKKRKRSGVKNILL